MIKGLIKKSSIYFLGLLSGRVISFVVFILFARFLYPYNFGNFVFFITLIQFITYFADFGLVQWYQKKAVLENKDELLSKVISARILTLFISLIFSLIFLFFSANFREIPSLVFLATLIAEAFLSVFDGYYLERRESFTVSLKTTLRMLTLFFLFLFFTTTISFELSVLVYSLSSFLVLMWYVPWKKISSLTINIGKDDLKTLKSSLSYALLIFSSFLYARGDSLVIRFLMDNTALGIYGAAYRFLESLSLIPTALAHNLFPISAKPDTVNISQLFKLVLLLSGLGMIISFFLYVASDRLILVFLGKDYVAAIPILKIFAGVLLLYFINSPLATIVQSSHLIQKFLPYGFANTILNIALNLVLVPHFGLIAAALIMLFTEVTGFCINLYFVKKIYLNKSLPRS